MPALEILQTKLTPPPVRSDRVHRPRLTQRFSGNLEHPLTLVCAPAGYGKSTLLSEWFHSESAIPIPFGWFSLDEDDNDPVRFLIYLISAFSNASGLDAGEMLALLNSPQPPPPKTILLAFISRLESFTSQLVLVLDDYHLITTQIIHDTVIYLIDHLPTHVFIFISSREDPPLPLARLRGRGQLAEIRAVDLRFTRNEIEQFLSQMLGTELNTAQIRDLDVRTEGWVAGLQLAAIAMKDRQDIDRFITAFTGSHRYVLDFLTDEVLSRQSETIRDFLLQTSVLSRLSGPLCDVVTSRSDGQLLLEKIERSNLFLIHLDDERYWYRYHHLFGDMLRRHLQQSHPDMVTDLHHRASIWFEQNGWMGEAIDHALAGKDHDRAAGLIEQRFNDTLSADGVQSFLRWMRRIPDDILRTHIRLELDYAFTLIAINSYSEAERHLLQAEYQLSQEVPANGNKHRELKGYAATVRMSFAFYLEQEADTIILSGMNALSLLPVDDIRWRSWSMVVIACSYYAAKGQVAEAENWFARTLQLLEQSNNTHSLEPVLQNLVRLYVIQGQIEKALVAAKQLLHSTDQILYRSVAHLELSKLYYERNDLQATIHHTSQGGENISEYALIQRTELRLAIEGYVILARFKNLQGAEGEARDLMQQAVEIVQKHDLRQIFLPVLAWQACLWLVQGDVAAAARWAEKIEPTIYGDLNPAIEFEHMTLARVFIALGRVGDAQELLARLLSAAHDGGRMGRVIGISVLQALAAKMQGNISVALDALNNALTLAEPEGYVRTFVDEGVPMRELLREVQRRGIAVGYVTKLLAEFNTMSASSAPMPHSRQEDLEYEPLSGRELEVLRLMAEGASNREIAATLVISIGTVKKHSSNIFFKLDVRTRTQAIVNARKYNIL